MCIMTSQCKLHPFIHVPLYFTQECKGKEFQHIAIHFITLHILHTFHHFGPHGSVKDLSMLQLYLQAILNKLLILSFSSILKFWNVMEFSNKIKPGDVLHIQYYINIGHKHRFTICNKCTFCKNPFQHIHTDAWNLEQSVNNLKYI